MQKPYSINQPVNTLAQTLNYAQPFAPDVLIFKTNIETRGDEFYMKPFLDKHPLIIQWNIDLEDIDCVLRIVSTHLDHDDIIDLLNSRGYFCEELL